MSLITQLSMKLKSYAQDYFDEEYAAEEKGVLIVEKDNKYGLLNASNRKLLTPLKYHDILEAAKGVYVASQNGCKGIINGKGQVVIPIMYDAIDVASNDLFSIGKYNRETREYTFGLIDYKNNKVTDIVYDKPIKFFLGYAIVQIGDKYGSLSAAKTANGVTVKTAMPIVYDDLIGQVRDGFVAVKFGKKYGYVNMEGETVIPFKFEEAYEFVNGCAAVKQFGKMGIIDYTGAKLVPCRYDDVMMFDKNGIAQVKLNGRYGCVNAKGKEVVPCSTIEPIGDDENSFKINLYWIEKNYREKANKITSKTGKEKLMREFRREINKMYEARRAYTDYLNKLEQKQALTEQYRKDYIDSLHIKRTDSQTAEQADSADDTNSLTELLDAKLHEYASKVCQNDVDTDDNVETTPKEDLDTSVQTPTNDASEDATLTEETNTETL